MAKDEQEEAAFRRRLKAIRDYLGLTQSEMDTELGLGKKSWQKYEAGTAPGKNVYEALAERGFNINWLFGNSENMILYVEGRAAHLNLVKSIGVDRDTAQHRKHLIQEEIGKYRQSVNPDDDRYVAIPLVDVKAAAGTGIIVDHEEVVDVLHFRTDWIHNELHTSPHNLRLLFVDGESMEPFLRAGDVILVNVTDNEASRDGIYVLRLSDALLVKRLQRLPGNVLRVSSDNPAYQSFDLSTGDMDGFAVIGRVVWMGRRI